MWISRTKHAYTGLTIHCLNADLSCVTICWKQKSFEHTSILIASELRDILQN